MVLNKLIKNVFTEYRTLLTLLNSSLSHLTPPLADLKNLHSIPSILTTICERTHRRVIKDVAMITAFVLLDLHVSLLEIASLLESASPIE
jgi:hypothetical protein